MQLPETNITSADYSDMTNVVKDYSVSAMNIDGVSDLEETYYDNSNWSQYLGYYKTIPELQISIDAKATWTVGKGFIADDTTTMILDTIRGWGKDTFNTILENMIRTYHIAGDAFAEIIKDEEGVLINLKPLDPGSIRIVVNKQGKIKRYEQISKIRGTKNKIFNTEDIFHLARNRVADEIHGVSIIKAVENIILMRNEAMSDFKRVLHRNISPLIIWNLDTDDPAKVAEFKTKTDKATSLGENLYIPKGSVEPNIISTAPNATLNPLPWIETLNSYFYQAVGVPDIITGSSKVLTEASAKIAYLAFQQTIEEEQLFIEENVLSQLNLLIQLEFPASLENEMLSDKPKVENRGIEQEQASQPNDTTAEMEGRK